MSRSSSNWEALTFILIRSPDLHCSQPAVSGEQSGGNDAWSVCSTIQCHPHTRKAHPCSSRLQVVICCKEHPHDRDTSTEKPCIINTVALDPGCLDPQRTSGPCLERFDCHYQEAKLLTSQEQRPRMLLNLTECTGQHPPNVTSAAVENP